MSSNLKEHIFTYGTMHHNLSMVLFSLKKKKAGRRRRVIVKVDAGISAFWNLCLAPVSIYTKNWEMAYGKATQSKHFGGDKWYVIFVTMRHYL